MSLPNVSSLCFGRARWLLLAFCICGAACKARLPDGVFVCAQPADCPSGFTCREGLCRRGSAESALTADAALPNETSAGEEAQGGNTAVGASGEGGRAQANGGRGGESASSNDAGSGKAVPPPPPPAFTPHDALQLPSGRSISAGGTYMRSEQYRAWTSLGQSPGTGYPVRASANYRVVGGIVGVLQSGQTP